MFREKVRCRAYDIRVRDMRVNLAMSKQMAEMELASERVRLEKKIERLKKEAESKPKSYGGQRHSFDLFWSMTDEQADSASVQQRHNKARHHDPADYKRGWGRPSGWDRHYKGPQWARHKANSASARRDRKVARELRYAAA